MKKIYAIILMFTLFVTYTTFAQNVSAVTITPSVGTGGSGAGPQGNDFSGVPITVEQGAFLTVTWTLTHGTNNIERAFFVIKENLSNHPGNIIPADSNVFPFPGNASPHTETERVFNIPEDAIIGDHLIKINGKNYNDAPNQTSVWGTVLNVPINIVAQGSLSTTKHNAFQFSVFPNPTNDKLNFQTKEPVSSVEVVNLIGQKVLSANTVKNALDVSALAKGVYVLKLSSSRGVATKRIVKQ
ncbi:hypothetical protein GCM10022291_30490 [Postechiella marina]|uniref:Secretion system C-terminal sorting domain-containing protein n=1 Tax=Postechiella marina TaxID=943941 RepID=A0ABP8CFV4_9FLAO